ncbi:unnamed protein product [Didymodactylos carnosus]|uniref:oleoyl-[acyl-carrier-protein] hydrolase n=1 Tax=Didymodactylos carnosus TaxID=1234261 RepID=A0A8S2D0Z1_9BILA|nr:unnamed protein product [Didymodactylos carnosus]CAF3602144.1 unnamed protein product [Didymodactylos carnosus]
MFVPAVCENGTILISGGLGGLGLTMSKWMIKDRGVKRLVLMSRRSIEELKNNDSQYDDWLHLQQIALKCGAFVEVVKVDVTSYDQVFELVKRINGTQYPLRGIIHGAMVLKDSLLTNLTQEILSQVMKPKVHGAWNLHVATQVTASPLHFFVMLSSLRNHAVNFGASSYNAGNEFLESLAHWRFNRKHLPALSVCLPAVSGAGFFHANRERLTDILIADGYETLPAIIVFKLMENLYIDQQKQTRLDAVSVSCPIIFAANWTVLQSRRDVLQTRLVEIVEGEYHRITKQGGETKNGEYFTDSIIMDIETIRDKVRAAIAKLFGSSNVDRIDVQKSLTEQGLDSLMGVSLINWIAKEFKVNIPASEIIQGMSIDNISEYIQTKLVERNSTSNVISTDPAAETFNKISETNERVIKTKSTGEAYTGISFIVPFYRSPNNTASPSLFCIHDITGLAQTFSSFATKLHEVCENSPSIYGFRASGYQQQELPMKTIQSIAEEYISQMKRIQPWEPYIILGYKFGALVAYEMAYQLKKLHNSTVQSLIFIDPDTSKQNNDEMTEIVQQQQNSVHHPMTNGDIAIEPAGMVETVKQKQNSVHHPMTNGDIAIEPAGMVETVKQKQNSVHHPMTNGDIAIQPAEMGGTKQQCSNEENPKEFADQVISALVEAKQNYQFHSPDVKNIAENILMISSDNNQEQREVWQKLIPHIEIEQIQTTNNDLFEVANVDIVISKVKETLKNRIKMF